MARRDEQPLSSSGMCPVMIEDVLAVVRGMLEQHRYATIQITIVNAEVKSIDPGARYRLEDAKAEYIHT